MPRLADRISDFVRDFTDGLQTGDVQRLFDRDARHAYRVLTREHAGSPEPGSSFRRFFYRAKILFLGLSYKLSPARRVLFACAIGAALLGFVEMDASFDQTRIQIDFSPLWFSASIGMLVFLLALELVDRVLVRDELEVARQLQRDLLPREAPGLTGYCFAHSYRTANEVGGDYYDFRPLPDGRLVVAIGDASGHGMAAGLLMAVSNAVLQLAADIDPTPERVATMLNGVLARTGDRRSFMSLFYAVLEPATGELEYVCAGHPFPLLRRADGEVIELGTGAFPLGVRDRLDLATARAALAPGDTLLLYSDGLPEAVDAAGQAFGYDRLVGLLEPGGNPDEIHERVVGALDRHLAGGQIQDDFSLVVIRRADS